MKDVVQDGTVINDYSYSYDADGNMLTENNPSVPEPSNITTASAITMTYGADNRLETYNGQPVIYDADGNMVNGPIGSGMGDFVYDSRNRLISTGGTTYIYDAENRRIGVNENGNLTSYVINPNSKLSQTLLKTDAQGNITYYVYGLDLIGQEQSGTYLNYHYDRRGSTTALTDMTGAVTDRFQYGPYGELVNHVGTTSTPFEFNGRDGVMTDSNGLYYMRARYYNPDIRRFINRDVVQGSIDNGLSLNRYAYVNGNPVSYVDPFGLCGDSDNPWADPFSWQSIINGQSIIDGFITANSGDEYDDQYDDLYDRNVKERGRSSDAKKERDGKLMMHGAKTEQKGKINRKNFMIRNEAVEMMIINHIRT